MNGRQQFAQLLRASVAQGRGVQQARPGDRKTGQQPRSGACLCGRPVAAHYNRRNEFVSCHAPIVDRRGGRAPHQLRSAIRREASGERGRA
jgi:hypothetical protein